MDIHTLLADTEYSEQEARTIRRSFRNLSFPHREQIYKLIEVYPEYKKPFLGALLATAYAESEGTKEATQECISIYEDLIKHMGS